MAGVSAEGDSHSAGQIVVETLLRERILYMELSDTMDDRVHGQVVAFSVLQADGRPVPAWVHLASNGSVLMDVPVDTPELALRLTAHLQDGSFVTQNVNLQTATGEVSQLESMEPEVPKNFREQLEASNRERPLFDTVSTTAESPRLQVTRPL